MSAKRQPPRRPRTAQRRRPGSGGRSKPSPAQQVAKLLDELQEDLRSGELLQAELAASFAASRHYPGYWAALRERRDVPHPANAALVQLQHVREARHADTAAILAFALSELAAGDTTGAVEVVDTLQKLRFLGGRPAPWEVGEPVEPTSCRVLRDVFRDELTVFIGAHHPRLDDEHVLAVSMLITSEPELDEISIAGPMHKVESNVRASLVTDPDAALHFQLVPCTLREALVLASAAVDHLYARDGRDLDEESLEYLALLEARLEQLHEAALEEGDGGDEAAEFASAAVLTELDELGTAAISERFTSSEEFAASGATREAAADLVDWATAEVAGGVARVSPIVVEMYAYDLREAGTGPTAAQAAAMRAWVDFCARHSELPEDARLAVHEAVDELMDGAAAR